MTARDFIRSWKQKIERNEKTKIGSPCFGIPPTRKRRNLGIPRGLKTKKIRP